MGLVEPGVRHRRGQDPQRPRDPARGRPGRDRAADVAARGLAGPAPGEPRAGLAAAAAVAARQRAARARTRPAAGPRPRSSGPGPGPGPGVPPGVAPRTRAGHVVHRLPEVRDPVVTYPQGPSTTFAGSAQSGVTYAPGSVLPVRRRRSLRRSLGRRGRHGSPWVRPAWPVPRDASAGTAMRGVAAGPARVARPVVLRAVPRARLGRRRVQSGRRARRAPREPRPARVARSGAAGGPQAAARAASRPRARPGPGAAVPAPGDRVADRRKDRSDADAQRAAGHRGPLARRRGHRARRPAVTPRAGRLCRRAGFRLGCTPFSAPASRAGAGEERSGGTPMSQGSSVASGLVRVTIASGSRRVDLVLPGSIPVAELVPELARSVGLLDASTVYGGYRLVTQEGRILVNNAGLTMQGIEDGGLLTVTAGVDDKAPRVYDDVVEAMADVVENELKPVGAGGRTSYGAGRGQHPARPRRPGPPAAGREPARWRGCCRDRGPPRRRRRGARPGPGGARGRRGGRPCSPRSTPASPGCCSPRVTCPHGAGRWTTRSSPTRCSSPDSASSPWAWSPSWACRTAARWSSRPSSSVRCSWRARCSSGSPRSSPAPSSPC